MLVLTGLGADQLRGDDVRLVSATLDRRRGAKGPR